MTNNAVWRKFYAWYQRIPWWGKVLAFLLLLLVGAAIVAISVFGKTTTTGADAVQEASLKTEEQVYAEKKKELEKALVEKKKREAALINQTTKLDAASLEKREKIAAAKSIEEVDAILQGKK
jgi:lactam utilization protein B